MDGSKIETRPNMERPVERPVEPPVSFTTGETNEAKMEFIMDYITQHSDKLKAAASRPSFPASIILKMEECIQDILQHPKYYPDINLAVLRLSSPVEWAAELYQHMTDKAKELCSRTSQPKDLADYSVEHLSDSMTVYLSFIKDMFYTGSGTRVSGKNMNGGRCRQHERGLNRNGSNGWHKAILKASKEGYEAQWVQAIDIRVKKIDHDTGLES